MSRAHAKPAVVLIGPFRDTGGMATALRLQMQSRLREQYNLILFDNSKRTPADRTLSAGLSAQWALLRELLGLLHRLRPEIVHIHTCSPPTFYRSVVDLLVAKCYACQVILHIHGGHFSEFLEQLGGIRRWLVRFFLRGADRIVVLGEHWRNRFRAFDDRLEPAVVPNGVDVPPTPKRWRPVRTRPVVFVGDLRAVKGVDDLIEAFAALPKRIRHTAQLQLIGPDREDRAPQLRARVNHLKLNDQVVILGAVPRAQVQRALRSAALFVLPSHYEALPIALLEAMACGLPCIASSVGGVPEVLTHGEDGLLVDAGNVCQITKCMKMLLDDPEWSKQLGRAARQKIRSTFSQVQVADSLAEVYETTLSESGAR